MDSMVQAYMRWHSKLDPILGLETAVPQPPAADSQGTYKVRVLDNFRKFLSLYLLRSPNETFRNV